MNIKTSITVKSKLFPEVSFTFRKFSEKRKQELNGLICEATYKLREQLAVIDGMKPEEGQKADKATEARLNNAYDGINNLAATGINPAYMKVYLKSVDGLEFDGVAATIATFQEEAPTDLYQEVVDAIRSQAELSVEEKNV